MSGLTVIDTDILIDAALHVREAVDYLAALESQSQLAISVITHMELLVGCRNKAELRSADHFLLRFRVLKLNEPVCDAALGILRQYRLSHGLAIPDALIAATAMVLGQPLASKNQRDYRFINGLQLLSYPGATP